MKFAAVLMISQLGFANGLAISTSAMASSAMPHSPPNLSFRPIEQPWPVKVGVVMGGLTIVGAELWWFLGRKQQKQQAAQKDGVQEILIEVDGGYRPDRIVVFEGQPVRLSFKRQDSNACLDELLIPDFGISTRLPVGQTTTVEFFPTKIGEYPFTCGMRMFRGVIEVQES
jgi:plastocyanin domain-containing protein